MHRILAVNDSGAFLFLQLPFSAGLLTLFDLGLYIPLTYMSNFP